MKRTFFSAALALPVALIVLPVAAAEEKAPAPAAAETKPPANPATAGAGGVYTFVQRNLVKAPDKK